MPKAIKETCWPWILQEVLCPHPLLQLIFTFLHPWSPTEWEAWLPCPPALDSFTDLLWTHQTYSTHQILNPPIVSISKHPHTHYKRRCCWLQVTQKLSQNLSHLLEVSTEPLPPPHPTPTAQLLGQTGEVSLLQERFNEEKGWFLPDMNASMFVLKYFFLKNTNTWIYTDTKSKIKIHS